MPLDPSISQTLWQRWSQHAHQMPTAEAIVHWTALEAPYRWTWENLIARARRYAAALRDAGVGQGDVCAIILRHHREFYPLYMGIEAIGALPAVLAYPNARLHPDKFRQGLEGMAERSGLKWLLTEKELDAMVRPLATTAGSTVRAIFFPLEWESEGKLERELESDHPPASPDDPCLLQHSSGTTGLQKAIVLSHRAVLQHVTHYGKAIAFSREDRLVSWLPLYHDMGLIAAFHLPLAFGIPSIQMDPFEWVSAPSLMLNVLSDERGTLAWLPNFAFNLIADRAHNDDLEGVRLDSVRMLINCSEPVRAKSLEKFAARFASIGLRPESLATCYAMAETTFAVTQSVAGMKPPVLLASSKELAAGRYVPAIGNESVSQCLSSGAVIDGCTISIVDTHGHPLPNDYIGELVVRSASMFDGYRNSQEKTTEVLRDGAYSSGDFGFCLDGNYYVIGRKKDIIIVAGKNLYPEDIEDAVNAVAGVIPGRVIAFGLEDEQSGTEQVCVVAETSVPETEFKNLRAAIVEAAMKIDVTISHVYFAPARWLIKSSSGKPSRSANRQRVRDELSPFR